MGYKTIIIIIYYYWNVKFNISGATWLNFFLVTEKNAGGSEFEKITIFIPPLQDTYKNSRLLKI